ncbi:MAG: hypothetical protein HOM14_10500 [Gammaproteobacteria bacterium]|jgi:hypothetical protein|nr:hypothetical protein [Gammaproteobacteria bacterium]
MTVFSLLTTILFFTLFSAAHADDLKENNIYRLGMTISKLKSIEGDGLEYTALKNSKFIIIKEQVDGNFIVRFNKIHKSNHERYKTENWVLYDKAYILPKKINGILEASAISKESITGLSAGPLIVPFKYRINDNSISGDATIGFYAGTTFEPGCSKSNWCFRITPLISAGISQVTVINNGESENKTSATWAAGFLITDWSDMNIGLIFGQDRVGDKSWTHEGETWFSFMIGWQLK